MFDVLPTRTENADVVLYTLDGGGHTWPGGKHLAEWIAGPTIDDISATKVMWESFAEHPRTPNGDKPQTGSPLRTSGRD
jgi:poly(3-hydroxybutyrate) depolymerase